MQTVSQAFKKFDAKVGHALLTIQVLLGGKYFEIEYSSLKDLLGVK